MIRKTLKGCKLVTARESISADVLSKSLKAKVPVFPDLGFFLQSDDKLKMKKYLVEKGVPIEDKKCVAITMRPYRFPSSDDPEEAYKNYKKSFADFIYYLDSKGFHTVLVEHTLSRNTHEDDGSSIRDILPLIEGCSYTFINDHSLNCRELKSLYSNCNYMVGTRFHSVIFAMAEGVPSIAISYGGNKGDGIMKDIGLSEYVIPIDKISYELLKQKFDSLVKNEHIVLNKINRYLKKAEIERERLKNLIIKLRKESLSESTFCS